MAKEDDVVRLIGLSAPETMHEAMLADEGVRGIDLAPIDDGLEAGIAAVFESIRSGGGTETEDADAGEADADLESDAEDDGITFALLTELNRLWERPPV